MTAELLWVCNVSNLLLSASIFFKSCRWIQVSTLWILCGIPFWIIDAIINSGFQYYSFLTHFGGGTIGVWALRSKSSGQAVWPIAVIYFAILQGIARLVTDPKLNINSAFKVPIWSSFISPYWLANTFNLIFFAILLFGIEIFLVKFANKQRAYE